MKTNNLATLLALSNTTVVIDINGQIRELLPGEVPGPGEVIVVLGQGATAVSDLEAQLIVDDGTATNINIDDEIAAVIQQIEQGGDPTQDPELATAAGGEGGSSPTTTGSIQRTGAETLASTMFETTGLESQGLSETQSLALLDILRQNAVLGADDGGNDNGGGGGEPPEEDNTPPNACSFEVDVDDSELVPIIFDSDNQCLDNISDLEDDAAGIQLSIMITSLPANGTLFYTDDEGTTRALTEDDLHVLGAEVDPNKLFDPDSISYVPDSNDDSVEIGCIGDPSDVVSGEDGFYNWGEFVSKTERLVTLENGNTIGISLVNNNGKELVQYDDLDPHIGWGLGDSDGNGLNKDETLIIDLSDNPLETVSFGLDGWGGHFVSTSNLYVEVTYTLQDGSVYVEQYQKDEGDVGNETILYEFSYSSPDNPIVQMEMTSNGGNWVLRYLSSEPDTPEDDSFTYVAVDSELATSEEAMVTLDMDDSSDCTIVWAEQGDEVIVGDESANWFTWLDDALDNGTDVVQNFDLGCDLIDITDILESDENISLEALVERVDVSLDENNVVFTVSDNGTEQTIVLEDCVDSFAEAGFIQDNSITNELEMLAQVLKTDAA